MTLRKSFKDENEAEAAEIDLCFFQNVSCVFFLSYKKNLEEKNGITDEHEESENEEALAKSKDGNRKPVPSVSIPCNHIPNL